MTRRPVLTKRDKSTYRAGRAFCRCTKAHLGGPFGLAAEPLGAWARRIFMGRVVKFGNGHHQNTIF